MEGKRPVSGQRSTSFNPEAATFSPVVSKTQIPTASGGPTPPASPRKLSRLPILCSDSPFRVAKSMRPAYIDQGDSEFPQLPAVPPDQKDMPLDALQKMLHDHHTALNQAKPSTAFQNPPFDSTVNKSLAHPTPGTCTLQRQEPDKTAPDVNELSTSLGLPGLQMNMNMEDSPVRSHNSRPSEGFPEGLYAQYLDGKSIYPDDTVMALRGVPGGFQDCVQDPRSSNREDEDGQAMKIVRPPPGFGGGAARMIAVEDHPSVASIPVESQYVPVGPAPFDPARRLSDLQSVSSSQHHGHAHHPSGRRHRPRAHTRVKRTDQGPEPSHADIYPDDAAWAPPRERYQPETAGLFPAYISQLPPQRQFRVEEAVSWPTPAEVYTREPDNAPRQKALERNPPAAATYTQQEIPIFNKFGQYLPANAYASEHQRAPSPFNIFKDHRQPSKEDIDDADQDSIDLIDKIPAMAQLGFSTADLDCDERPLTPRQLDAKRYGLEYMGLGVGDVWNAPTVSEGEPFRVRLRNHDGWGGWEWAIKKGWSDE